MYVYGGRYVTVIAHSNDLYEYNFDTPNGETATMSLVNQTNKGPSCSFCGAVMIDESHMMILSHKFANSSANSTESRTVVRPYIFDFVSLTWTENELPAYNKTHESIFYMRARHSTVLGKDGMVYVIGGTNFYEDSVPLTTSYFYDPFLNYYGIIDNNGFDYKAIGPSAFNLPSHNTMMVLNTKTKTWIRNQTLSTTLLDDKQFKEGIIEGVAVQLVPNTDCAVFFGLPQPINNKTETYIFKKLNLITNIWDNIQAKKYQLIPHGYQHNAYENSYASSIVVSNRYIVFAFGLIKHDYHPQPNKDVDIFDLLYQKPDNENISSSNFSFDWVPTISQYKRLAISGTGSNIYASPSAIFFAVLIGVVAIIIIIISVSSTEESFETNDVPFPDIRICYNGWGYRSYNDTDGDFPFFICSRSSNPYEVDYCEDVHELPRSILSPNFMLGDTKCYMYAPPKDKLSYIHQNDYVEFHHFGESLSFSGKSVYIQLYEPTKNPNRVVFDISPFHHQHSAQYLDTWIEFQINNSFIHGTAGQKITLNGLPGVNLHFKTTYTQKIDPDSLWNLVGIFPKYTQVSELSVTSSEVVHVSDSTFQSGTISIYPLDQQKTVITEKRDVTIMSTLGVLGGIASMLIAMRALLFGARPPKPWGVFQGLSFKSSWEQSRSKNLKRYFRIPGVDNVPFATPVHQRFSDIYTLNENHSLSPDSSKSRNQKRDGFLSESSASGTQIESSSIHSSTEYDKNKESSNSYYNVHERLEQLEARNQILELVLRAYYIDDRIFREIHENGKKEVNTESTLLPEEKEN
ncbi:hypothetical protein INT47_000106 [Mucor saturninus]|uniref:Galactose oxidase n=1 Tax=Mucor saturninus TaxID=64648 RepID=A0A8H7RH84_9FUNG|nr:hypothetical protein INT47_000106 [Mucor saturninus]